MGGFGGREIVILLVVILVLFGSAKLPELARSMGKSMRILKEETKSLTSDGESTPKPPAQDEANGS
jgi:sec-independent protein translocase protein TatA